MVALILEWTLLFCTQMLNSGIISGSLVARREAGEGQRDRWLLLRSSASSCSLHVEARCMKC